MLRAGAAITTLLLAAGLITPVVAQAAGDVVRYEVVSNGSISLVTYFDYIGDIEQDNPRAPTWGWQFTNMATYPFYSVSAQTEGTQVACRLFVNGVLEDSNVAYGRYTIVDCSGD